MGKKNKYNGQLWAEPSGLAPPFAEGMIMHNKPSIRPGVRVPKNMICDIEDSGLYLGLETKWGKGYYVGRKSEDDGNVLIAGINGSGKSYFLARSMIATWHEPFVALDIKGELSRNYGFLQCNGRSKRAYIIFAPINGGVHYEPFAILKKDDIYFKQNVEEIAYAIIPGQLNNPDKYWSNMARFLLIAIIIYGFSSGLDFIETMIIAVSFSVAELCKKIIQSDFELAKRYIRDFTSLKREQLAAISTDLKQHIMIFATDPCIQAALSNTENEKSFSWDDITADDEAPNIFLRLNQDRLEQWGGMMRLMLTQLIRTLERRPDKQSPQGCDIKPFLLLLDEFPLLGKMDAITNALTTLRSKKVSFCLMIQSIAQLDAVYGSNIRKIIVDNCQYKVILNITEPESQEYFSRLIGSVPIGRRGMSQNYDPYSNHMTYGQQIQEFREPLILSYEFATNKDIWLHTPYGFFSTIKLSVSVTHKNLNDFDKAIELYRGQRNDW